MAANEYTHTLLGRRARCVPPLVYVELRPGAEAALCREHAEALAARWPGGRLRYDPCRVGGKRYVRLSWPGGGGKRLSVARIILSLHGEGEQDHRQARFKDGNPLNLTPENLSLSERGPVAGTDEAHQETAGRGWRLGHAASAGTGVEPGA